MEQEERLKLYDEALKVWGKEAQYDQCNEEMAELMIAINKLKRATKYGEFQNIEELKDNLIEEISDVFLCSEALLYYFKNEKSYEKLNEKLEKFKSQIEKQKKTNEGRN